MLNARCPVDRAATLTATVAAIAKQLNDFNFVIRKLSGVPKWEITHQYAADCFLILDYCEPDLFRIAYSKPGAEHHGDRVMALIDDAIAAVCKPLKPTEVV